jgi:T5SS/PEP-CTERM-associated repeat protein
MFNNRRRISWMLSAFPNTYFKMPSRKLAIVALALAILSSPARAQIFDGGGDGVNWNNANNWNPATVPGHLGAVSIGGTYSVIFNDNYTSSNAISSLTLDGGNSTSTAQLTQNADGDNLYAPTETIGLSNGAIYNQSAGTNGTDTMYIGKSSTSTAFYNLSGDGVLTGETPFASSILYVGWSGTGTFTQSGTSTNSMATIVLAFGSKAGTYNFESGTISADAVTVGSTGKGDFNQTGGNSTVNTVTIGDATTSGNGTYELSTGTLTAGNEYLGGAGTFTQTSGTNFISGPVSTPELDIGYLSATTGTAEYLLKGGLLTGPSENIGYGRGDLGDLNQTAGSNETTSLDVGLGSGATGTYELTGSSSLLITGVEYIGDAGTGTFTQAGGTNKLDGDDSVTNAGGLIIGNQSGSHGEYLLESGTLTPIGSHSVDFEVIGAGNSASNGDTADLKQTGGTNLADSVTLGENAGSIGTYELSGDNSSLLEVRSTKLIVGDSGTGSFTQTGGTVNVAGQGLYVGYNEGSVGHYNMQGGFIENSFQVIGFQNSMANGDVADFNQSGGNNNASLILGSNAGSVGTYELSGSSSTINSSGEIIGDNGTGTFTQTGGSNSVSGEIDLGDLNGASGTYTMSNGAQLSATTLNVAPAVGGKGAMTIDGSSTHVEVNQLAVGGSTKNPGGTGTLTLTGGATIHASSTVSAGINGTIDATGGAITIGSNDTAATLGEILINTGGVLAGNGTFIANKVINGGNIVPGDPTTMHIQGDYEQTANGVLTLDIAGAGAGDYDTLDITGALKIDSGATLKLNFIDGFAPTLGETFDLIGYQTVDPLNASFTTVDIEGLAPGFDYTLTPVGLGGTDVQLTALNDALTAVPEPSTYALLLLGGGLLFWQARRRSILARR